MIDQRLFKDWLNRAISFANSSEPGESSELLQDHEYGVYLDLQDEGRILDPAMYTFAPLDRRREMRMELVDLHTQWRDFLSKFVKLPRGRTWLIERARDLFHSSNVALIEPDDYLPVSFDSGGRPQLGSLRAKNPEGMIAIVAAELLSPDATQTVCACDRFGCSNFYSVPTAQAKRTAGGTVYWCDDHPRTSRESAKNWREWKAYYVKLRKPMPKGRKRP